MRIFLLLQLCISLFIARAQNSLYYPPLTGTIWDTVSASTLGWCTAALDSAVAYAAQHNSKAFIILHDGKIVREHYFGTFKRDSIWYWASAGKSLTAVIVGIAQQEGLLNINDTSSKYLGAGWTAATPTQEAKIKIIHQLTMTTGIDYNVADDNCTIDTCLKYRADAGMQWYYHNAPYRLLHDVVAAASGTTFNNFCATRVGNKIGMQGAWVNGVYYSKARGAARFGLLCLGNGVWNNDTILRDQSFLSAMRNSSQNLNLSYGYLWWLAGKSSFMLPQSSIVFNTTLCPSCPSDMYAAMGKNDQKIYIVPSKNMVVVRMGNAAGVQQLGPSGFDDELWKRLNLAFCNSTGITENENVVGLRVAPNPFANFIFVTADAPVKAALYDSRGCIVKTTTITQEQNKMRTDDVARGLYLLKIGEHVMRMVKLSEEN